jgi:hypothetical protein
MSGALEQVATCQVCGCSPCANRSFCKICIEQDTARRKPDHNLPPKWDQMSVGALWEHLNDPRRHPLPKSIIDTFKHLIKQGDPERLKAWLAQRAPEERRALRKLVEK